MSFLMVAYGYVDRLFQALSLPLNFSPPAKSVHVCNEYWIFMWSSLVF